MKPERWNEVDKVLQSVLERAPAEREPYLAEVCSGDEDLLPSTKDYPNSLYFSRDSNYIYYAQLAYDTKVWSASKYPTPHYSRRKA